MSTSEKSKIKCAIEVFYLKSTPKDRKSITYHEFKDSKINGHPLFNKQGFYKKCVQEIDMNMIIKMFDNLPPKIVKAKNNGLENNQMK